MTLRVLYRLRFLCEQHPLDLISFQFCLPLALDILNVSPLTEKQRAEVEEQVTLVLEFISFQASLCSSSFSTQLIGKAKINKFTAFKSYDDF